MIVFDVEIRKRRKVSVGRLPEMWACMFSRVWVRRWRQEVGKLSSDGRRGVYHQLVVTVREL
jgi:hypothetical protein